jgi:dienelactone hydrolase
MVSPCAERKSAYCLIGTLCIQICLGLLLNSQTSGADEILPGTVHLTVDRPLDQMMVEGLNRFCLRELADSPHFRSERWKDDLSSPVALEKTLTDHRNRFRQLIGAVDARPTSNPSETHDFELITTLHQSSILAKHEFVTVHRVRWPVLEGVSAEGLLLVPKTIHAAIIALPDADWTPEMFCGLQDGLPETAQVVRRLAEAGCMAVVPMLLSRSDEFSGHSDIGWTNQSHREFIYRQAFEVGRHVIGYEVQKVLAAVDLLERHLKSLPANQDDAAPEVVTARIGILGFGEGGLLGLYAAALDPRITTCWVSGYFQQRESIWQEPIYRNVWGLLTEFGDAELAGMIAPRRLIIESCRAVNVEASSEKQEGRRAVAAPGKLRTSSLNSVRAELERANAFYLLYGKPEELTSVVSGENGDGPPGTEKALVAFAQKLGVQEQLVPRPTPWTTNSLQDKDQAIITQDAKLREKRQFDELQAHVQNLLLHSHQVRDARWRLNPAAIDEWNSQLPAMREWVHKELIGQLPHRRLPLKPRSRRVLQNEDYVAHEIVLDVFDDVIAAGILLMPKNIKADEKRPVVVCQHGLEGTPMDTISREAEHYRYYKSFSEELVKQGYIVYAPQNPYRGGDEFRQLQRMSNPLQRSLFSYIIAQHEQTLDWLATLPQVDSTRIAFYGLSYGGKTAMRVPPLVEKYSLSICSGDFTDWPRTMASNNEKFSYLFTSEYEVFEWNLAHVASYAELAMLMTPRPFMVEEGHRDSGQPSEWVAGEFGKVRRHYDQLGLGDRAVLEFFDGPHTIHGKGTFEFLRRHLNPPQRP